MKSIDFYFIRRQNLACAMNTKHQCSSPKVSLLKSIDLFINNFHPERFLGFRVWNTTNAGERERELVTSSLSSRFDTSMKWPDRERSTFDRSHRAKSILRLKPVSSLSLSLSLSPRRWQRSTKNGPNFPTRARGRNLLSINSDVHACILVSERVYTLIVGVRGTRVRRVCNVYGESAIRVI